MIYTRFGSEVEVIKGDIDTGEVDVKRLSDGKVLKIMIYELKADGAIHEIAKAIKGIK